MSDIIIGTNLTVIRDGNRLIDDVSVTLPLGKISMVLGHNGAGKTILIRTLHNLITADGGSVSGPAHQDQKMVFQKPILLRRSVREHFDFVCPRLDNTTALEWLNKAGLGDLTDRYCHSLSGGEQQKLALVGAMASTPKLLFLDEPTAHLDIESTMFIENMITNARKSGMSIIMISHSRSQAERLAEHIVFLEAGKLVELTTATRFFTGSKNAVVNRFLAHI